jgi:hypothetical protein
MTTVLASSVLVPAIRNLFRFAPCIGTIWA